MRIKEKKMLNAMKFRMISGKKLVTLLVVTLFIGVLMASPMDKINDWAAQQTQPFDANDVVTYMNGNRDDDITFGLEYVFNSANTRYNSADALDATHFVVAYQDNGNSNYGTAVIGTVPGSTITYGSEYVYNSAATGCNSVSTMDTSHFVVAYRDIGNSDYGTAVIGTISGSTITYGSEYVFNSDPISYTSVFALDYAHFVVAYRDEGNSLYGTAVIGTVSGSTITFGSEYVFNSAHSLSTSVSALDAAHFVVAYRDNGNSYYGTAVIGSVSGSTITFGSEYVFNSANSFYNSVSALDAAHFVVAYSDEGNSDYGTAVIGEIGGPTSITLSSFTATYYADELAVCWSTQSESNNAGWNIYRSDNECIEEAIQVNGALIEGAGTTSEPTDYTFYDLIPVQYGITYNYWLESRDYTGATETYGPVSLFIPQPGDDPNDPNNGEFYGLYQNTPNPMDNTTSIKFNLPEAVHSTLTIYNTKGQTVKTFSANTESGEFTWDRKDNKGNEVASGLYFYRLDAGDDTFIKKMVVSQ